VLEVIQQTGALDYARQRAQAESETASNMISSLPDTDYKQSLLDLSTFAVARNY
jgi:octaprenyl-diphosphate synthase